MPIETATQEHRPVGITAAAPWRVRTFEVLSDYRISITCNDGTSGVVDMSVLVNSADAGIFAALKDAELFRQVIIELGVITWPNGADLDPVWLHEEIGKSKTWSVPG